MTPDPIELFLSAVKKSGLIADEELKLVEKNVLTAYQAERLLAGIVLRDRKSRVVETPATIENCAIKTEGHGVELIGSVNFPCSSVVIRDNHIVAATGIALEEYYNRVRIVGNRVRCNHDLRGSCLAILAPIPDVKDIFVANNTFDGGMGCVQINEHVRLGKKEFTRGQFVFRNIVIINGKAADIILVKRPPVAGDSPVPTPCDFLLKLWVFEHNRRDFAGKGTHPVLPKSPKDHMIQREHFESLNVADKRYLQPKQGTPVASAGAGIEDPSLPRYVGAVPPAGVAAWQWKGIWSVRDILP